MSTYGAAPERGGQASVNGLGRDDHGIGIRHRVQSRSAEMIAVSVTDQNQVGSRKPLKERGGPHGIVVDHLSVPTHHQGGVVDWVKNHLAIVGGQVIAGHEVCPTELERAIMARGKIRRGGIGVLVETRTAQREQRVPMHEIRRNFDPVTQTCWGVQLEQHFPVRPALNSRELRCFLSD